MRQLKNSIGCGHGGYDNALECCCATNYSCMRSMIITLYHTVEIVGCGCWCCFIGNPLSFMPLPHGYDHDHHHDMMVQYGEARHAVSSTKISGTSLLSSGRPLYSQHFYIPASTSRDVYSTVTVIHYHNNSQCTV
jgi:hypothetical protein